MMNNAIATPDNVTPHPSAATQYVSVTDTAKILRGVLKGAFPGVKFSVRSESYSGGASINIQWVDGPITSAVDEVMKPYAGATFDGMIDLKSSVTAMYQGRRVRFGADYIFTYREHSAEFLRAIATVVSDSYDIPAPEVRSHHNRNSYYSSNDLLPEWLRGRQIRLDEFYTAKAFATPEHTAK